MSHEDRIAAPLGLENRDVQRVVRDLTDRYRKHMFEDGDTTPSVAAPTVEPQTWHFQNSTTTTITEFSDGFEGQVFYVVMDGPTRIANNDKIKLNVATVTEYSASSNVAASVRLAIANAAITLTLPDPSTLLEGRTITFKNMVSGTLTIAPNDSENIDGANSSISLTTQYDAITLQTDQTDWYAIGEYSA